MTDNETSLDAVVIERSFDAPVDLIWQMWTVPEHFKAWYGPAGATIPMAKMDVRPGGQRLVCMEMASPNGPMRMWFSGEYVEVVEHERLVYTESMSDENGQVSPANSGADGGHPTMTEVRVELSDIGGRTKMRLTHTGIPEESAGAAGWAMALDSITDGGRIGGLQEDHAVTGLPLLKGNGPRSHVEKRVRAHHRASWFKHGPRMGP